MGSDKELIAELRYQLRREERKAQIYRDAIGTHWMDTTDADAAVEDAMRRIRR